MTRLTASGRLSAAERRATLLDAAWELLREQGPAAVTIDAVVERLSISRPMFYRHFSDRAGLVAALYDDYASALSRRTRDLLTAELPPQQFLLALFAAYLDCVGERGASVRALVEYFANVPAVEAARARLREQQTDLVTRGLSARAPAATRAQVRHVVRLLNALSMESATWWLAGEVTRGEAEELAARLLEGGVLALLAEPKRAKEHG